jgi:hypothetical protein
MDFNENLGIKHEATVARKKVNRQGPEHAFDGIGVIRAQAPALRRRLNVSDDSADLKPRC